MNFFLISFILGTALADFFTFNQFTQKVLVTMLLLLLFITLIWRKERLVKIPAFSAIALILALFYSQMFVQKSAPQYISYYNGQTLTLQGIVDQEPNKSNLKNKLILRINSIKGKVLVNAPNFPEYQYGDILKVKGKLEEPPVFDEFNFRNYLKSQGVFSLVDKPEIEKIGEIRDFSLKKYLLLAKSCFEQTLNKILPEPEAALANGLLLGTRQNISDDLIQVFVTVGLIHIIALSGYNITIISKNLSIFFNYLAPRLTFTLSIAAIWLFVLMVGASPSIVRAALMGSLVLIGRKIGRRRDMSRVLLLTALVMILQNPYILRYDAGFQLSFLATLGLIYFSPILERFVGEVASTTLAAQIFVLPILLFSFKKISLMALLANVLVLPIIPLAMFFVFLAGILGQPFGWFSFLFLRYIVLISENLSKVPYASIEIKRTSIIFAVLYWLVLGFLIRFFKTKRHLAV